jgi:hypothetical protein
MSSTLTELLPAIHYYPLRTHEAYYDLGADYHDRRTEQGIERHAVRQLQSLGYDVSHQPREPAA